MLTTRAPQDQADDGTPRKPSRLRDRSEIYVSLLNKAGAGNDEIRELKKQFKELKQANPNDSMVTKVEQVYQEHKAE